MSNFTVKKSKYKRCNTDLTPLKGWVIVSELLGSETEFIYEKVTKKEAVRLFLERYPHLAG